jgi:hypothetical protein
MAECPTCSKLIEPPAVRCSNCGVELHRACAKKTLGRWYCKGCYKEAKKQAKFERMAQRASTFGAERPGKLW